MDGTKARLSFLELCLVACVAGAIFGPHALFLAPPAARFWIMGGDAIVTLVTLFLLSKQRAFIHSSLWKWLPPLFFFRNVHLAYRLIIVKYMACVEALIVAYVLVLKALGRLDVSGM